MLDTYRELLDMLAVTPTQLKDAAQLAGAPPTGEWSAAEVLAHMAAAEQLWLERLNAMLRERDARLGPPRQQVTDLQARLMGQPVEENLAAYNALRGETISMMMGLSLTDWTKTATHHSRGEMRIDELVEDMVDHDSEHLAQLQALAGT
jgi:uncharacterized damage-inducible protein DinB